jgi:hypothetical protein
VFEIVQILYWLALATWFGSVLFVAVTAPVIMRAVREANPVMTSVLSVNLEGQHATLLGGSIIGSIVSLLVRVELACAAALVASVIGHWALLPREGTTLLMNLVRAALLLAAIGLLVYRWRVAWPRLWHARQEYLDHADEPDVANPALDRFEHHQREIATVLFVNLTVLLGLILFSANIRAAILIPAG